MNRQELLLNLAIHRYDEVNNRNDLIDNKNKSMIAFVGLLLSLEVNIIPSIIKIMEETFPVYSRQMVICLMLVSLLSYLISIIKFIRSVKFVESFKEAPNMEDILCYGRYNEKKYDIIIKTLNSFKICIENNNKIIEKKATEAKKGFKFLYYGVITTTLFIILFILMYGR